jgi:hypothetical protein
VKSENLAVQQVRRAAEAILARDWEVAADSYAAGLLMDDRRAGLKSTLDRAEAIAMVRVMGDLGVDAIEIEVVDVRGDHVALCRIANHVQDFTVTTLSVAKADENGRLITFVMFDDDELEAALAELDALASNP